MTTVCTTKQFGDACEHYVISQLGFANIPAQKMPDCWPGYDLTAQPRMGHLLRINVKGRRLPSASSACPVDGGAAWDWLAVVLCDSTNKLTRCWMLPRKTAISMSTPYGAELKGQRRLNFSTLRRQCERWEDYYDIR